ncbi:type VII secretion target [Micromonospora sp. NPDC049559]|uniref:WXG100 family type VII secretion target n=1 Tax=Micromonospora sp. NPDC049559 TaxID=3155923 RepID=UPI003441A436
MSFSVEPGALERAAAQLKLAGTDVQAAMAYISKHTEMNWYDQGLLNKAYPAHRELVDEMTRRLTHLKDLLEQSEEALQRTATHYRNTDAGNARRLDATYPYVARGDEELADDRPSPTDYP